MIETKREHISFNSLAVSCNSFHQYWNISACSKISPGDGKVCEVISGIDP